jgi:hypothetical protein
MDENAAPTWVLWSIGIGIYLLIVGGVGTYIAEMKGRSVGEGFLFGFFFGPLGLVIEACMPTLEARGKGHFVKFMTAPATETPPAPTERRTATPVIPPKRRRLMGEVDE